jgi:hypothetical protein
MDIAALADKASKAIAGEKVDDEKPQSSPKKVGGDDEPSSQRRTRGVHHESLDSMVEKIREGKADKMIQIVLAKVNIDHQVDQSKLRRTDMGERPIMKQVDKPVSMMWLNRGTQADVQGAQAYARTEGYTVFTYDTSEHDPLRRAKEDITRMVARGEAQRQVD